MELPEDEWTLTPHRKYQVARLRDQQARRLDRLLDEMTVTLLQETSPAVVLERMGHDTRPTYTPMTETPPWVRYRRRRAG